MANGKCAISDRWKQLRTPLGAAGYPKVSLRNEAGTIVDCHVHRLVLLAFRGPCPPGHQCCHGNGVRTDNCLENLRWDTLSNNQADRKRHGTHDEGERSCRAKLTNEQARFINDARGTMTKRELAQMFGVSVACIKDIYRKKSWRHLHENSTTT